MPCAQGHDAVKNRDRQRPPAEIRETVPEAPGVYAFLDAHCLLLYIGKSVNLRQRMSSYFRQDPLAADPHIGRLTAHIKGFAWWQTRSELLALLLEDALIKEHLPPHNTRQRDFAENRYIELTGDEFPACVVVEHARDFGTREVYGPVRDRHAAAALQDILHRTLRVRTCSESEPARRCLEYDIGRCAGPCRGSVEEAEYRELVARVRAFLQGEPEALLRRLYAAMKSAASERHFENAASLRDDIRTCTGFAAQQAFARRFSEGTCRIHSEEDGLEYCFRAGALLKPRDVIDSRGKSELLSELEATGRTATSGPRFSPEAAEQRAMALLQGRTPPDRRLLADRSIIVGRWNRRRGDTRIVWRDAELVSGPSD
jgi:excinuclease UvrABC nuclease subunit